MSDARASVSCCSALSRLSCVVCRLLPPFCLGCFECCRPLRCGGEKTYARSARSLRRNLQSLGPAFVKLGQAVSAREDILTHKAAAELRKLCDSVPPFPRRDAARVLREDLGDAAPLLELPDSAVAAASLGQVYRLRVGGAVLALKVQRPGLRESIVVDVVVISLLAGAVRRCVRCCCVARVDPVRVIQCWAETLWEELDYVTEATNMELTRSELVAKGRVRGLVIPAVHWSLTSERVLATDWVCGTKVTDRPRAIGVQHLRIGIEAYTFMIMDLGIAHADPHAGNLLVLGERDENICMLDFGMVVKVPESHRHAWARSLVHMIRGEPDKTLDALIQIGFFPPECPRAEVLPVMTKIWRELVASGSDIQKRKDLVRSCFSEFKTLAMKFDFDLPDYYLTLVRALLTLEGIALTADCDFDIFQAIFPVALRIVAGEAVKDVNRRCCFCRRRAPER